MNETTTNQKNRNTDYRTLFKTLKEVKSVSEFLYIPNGLRVLLAKVPGSPTVTTNIVYRVGSKDEVTGETGLSHMLEHMLFKATSGDGVKWKDLENSGALMNATTWLDRTLYYFTLPESYLSDMLAVEADRMRNLIITDKEFMPERANVLSEYEMYNSRPDMALEREVTTTAFQYHGYHHETIGFRSDIESYSTKLLKDYYDRYYWPSNATLIVAGDIDVDLLKQLVHRHFCHIKDARDAVTRIVRTEPKQEGERRIVLVRNTPVRIMNIAYKAPSFTEQAWTALSIALMELTDGETSVLYRRLVDTHMATNVSAELYPTMDPFLAFFTINAALDVSYEHIEEVVWASVAELARKPIPKNKHALIKEIMKTQDIFSRDGSHAVAIQLGEYVATGNWERYFYQLDELDAITPEETMDAVRTYLTRSQATIGTIHKP